jgi:hypothetical protein
MRNIATLLLSGCIAFATIAGALAQNDPTPSPTPDPKVYGEYPTEWKQIVNRWLETKLVDPTSAVIDWGDAPKPGEYKTQKGEQFVGYVVDLKVNARNQFGAPTGKQRYRVVIHDGEVAWGGHPRY